MNTRHLLSVAVLLVGAVVTRLGGPVAFKPPIPGPGGVAVAVRELLAQQDAAGDCAGLLVDRRHEVDFVVAEGKLEMAPEGAVIHTFFDLAADGSPVAAPGAAAFAKLSASRIARDEKLATGLRSEVRSIRASCEAEQCSSAIVAFDRFYTDAAGEQHTVPMQATALLLYDREAPGGRFRVFHWHASRRAVAR